MTLTCALVISIRLLYDHCRALCGLHTLCMPIMMHQTAPHGSSPQVHALCAHRENAVKMRGGQFGFMLPCDVPHFYSLAQCCTFRQPTGCVGANSFLDVAQLVHLPFEHANDVPQRVACMLCAPGLWPNFFLCNTRNRVCLHASGTSARAAR